MVYILLCDGFEDIEALAPADLLRRAGIETVLCGLDKEMVCSAHGVTVKTDMLVSGISLDNCEMLVLPGGAGVKLLRGSKEVEALVRKANDKGLLIGAICAAPTLLAEMGLLKGRRAVCFPSLEHKLTEGGALVQRDERVTHDRNIITATAAGSSIAFGLKLVGMLRGWRASEDIRLAICYDTGEKALS